MMAGSHSQEARLGVLALQYTSENTQAAEKIIQVAVAAQTLKRLAQVVIVARTVRKLAQVVAVSEAVEKQARLEAIEEILQAHLVPGDFVTHTRCMGCLEEHVYTGRDGVWLCGKPTRDTVRMGGSNYPANDIHPRSVTHINRVPIDSVPFLAKVAPK